MSLFKNLSVLLVAGAFALTTACGGSDKKEVKAPDDEKADGDGDMGGDAADGDGDMGGDADEGGDEGGDADEGGDEGGDADEGGDEGGE